MEAHRPQKNRPGNDSRGDLWGGKEPHCGFFEEMQKPFF